MSDQSAPVNKKARIQSIDTLRGVALCGILLMNIIGFGLPLGSYYNPIADLNIEGANLTAYMTIDVLAEGSMRAIFSMLFGAGILLFTNKPDSDAGYTKSLWYRRTLLLVAFGLLDAYLFLWFGDILYVYGMAGLVLYFFKDLPPLRLLMSGLLILTVTSLINWSSHNQMRGFWLEVQEVESVAATTALDDAQQAVLDEWQNQRLARQETPEQSKAYIAERKKGFASNFMLALPVNIYMQTVGFLFGSLWDAMAMMLMGMALMKWRVFSASLPARNYLTMVVLGFGIGLSVNLFEVTTFVASGFASHWSMSSIRPTYELGRLATALGYIGLIMLLCKFAVLIRLQAAFASVGQMALTNYLSHSVICLFIFSGVGLGLAGELERYQIYYVVCAIWVFQLITSPIWLRYYRFGPVEWLWRCLTYKTKQPLKL